MSAKSFILIAFASLWCCASALSQSTEKEPESLAIVELGASASWDFTESRSSISPTVAVEVTPIEKWLELEAGVTPTFRRHSTEWDVDFLFKKPWTLSNKVEFMAGIGPAWSHLRQAGVSTNSVAAEGVLDFMFWPWKKRRFGLYVEPSYDYGFGPAHERSAGVSGGLLISIP